MKAFFHYLEYKELIDRNPFSKIQVRFRGPVILPKTIPLHTVETFLTTIYRQRDHAKTDYQKRSTLRDAAVTELLFATGMRISELCTLKNADVNLYDGIILIFGKGSKQRRIQIGNYDVIHILKEYKKEFITEIENCNYFFVSPSGKALSDQSVRRMINKYTSLAAIDLHITPSYVSTHFRNQSVRGGCRYPLYPGNAWSQFHQYNRNIYSCCYVKAA